MLIPLAAIPNRQADVRAREELKVANGRARPPERPAARAAQRTKVGVALGAVALDGARLHEEADAAQDLIAGVARAQLPPDARAAAEDGVAARGQRVGGERARAAARERGVQAAAARAAAPACARGTRRPRTAPGRSAAAPRRSTRSRT